MGDRATIKLIGEEEEMFICIYTHFHAEIVPLIVHVSLSYALMDHVQGEELLTMIISYANKMRKHEVPMASDIHHDVRFTFIENNEDHPIVEIYINEAKIGMYFYDEGKSYTWSFKDFHLNCVYEKTIWKKWAGDTQIPSLFINAGLIDMSKI